MPALLRALLVLPGLASLGGCVAPRLADERCQAPYAEYLGAYEASARRQERHVVEAPGGLRVAVALEHVQGARGQEAPTLVLQPGILAGGETWRFLAGALRGEHEMLLVDPPGTGRSDAPDPRVAREPAYSPTWLAGTTLAAVEAFEREHGERKAYVLVGHSLGGAVVLRALADPGLRARHAALLARVRGALLFNPAHLLIEEHPKALLDIARLSDLEAGVAERLGLLQKTVRTGVRDNVSRPERDALRSEALRIEALMGRPATRHAVQATLLRFQPQRAGGLGVDLDAARRLAEPEGAIDVPVRIVWGTADTTLDVREGVRLCERLPGCRLVPLQGVGHSSHQERLDGHLDEVRALLAEIAGSAPAGGAPKAP